MHLESMTQMALMVTKYMAGRAHPLKMLDVGAYNVNGTYRAMFERDDYTGCDIRPGPGVDVVQALPYLLPFGEGTFDAVLCGQVLEHCPQPWRLVAEMGRVVREGGYVFIIAPSDGQRHEAVDAWRILPEGMRGLAEWAGLDVVECQVGANRPWRDTSVAMMRPLREGIA